MMANQKVKGFYNIKMEQNMKYFNYKRVIFKKDKDMDKEFR